MKTLAGLCVGNSDLSVSEILSDHSGLLAGLPWALVTSIDSETDLSKLRPPSVFSGKIELVGKAGLLRTDAALEIARAGGFTGFDEAWFCRVRPTGPPPAGVCLVGPASVEEQDLALLAAMGEWMRASGCDLGLGDGDGLNFVSMDWKLADSIDQIEEEGLGDLPN